MPLSPHLRERILRQLDTLTDEKGYQVLDYLEFVASKYGSRESSLGNVFARFTEGVEDTLRAGRVSATAISETMGLLNKAAGVLNGVAAAGKSVASDIASVAASATRPTAPPTDGGATAAPPEDPAQGPPPGVSPA